MLSAPRVKLTIAMLVPILVGGISGTLLLWSWTAERTEARANHFARAIVAQVAVTVTDPLLQEDALSLNVILGDLVRRGDVSFASVYSADNRLMAQAGRRTDELQLFNHDISFQNTSAGYVQLGLSRDDIAGETAGLLSFALSVWLIIAGTIAAFGWLYGDLLYLWLGGAGSTKRPTDESEPEADAPEAPEPVAIEQTILVIKIRPYRQLDAHFESIMKAIALYGGEAQVTDGDDIIVVFRRAEQLTRSECTARLINALMSRARGNIAVKTGLHQYRSDDDPADIEKARKHATYLASIADGNLLVSRRVFEEADTSHRARFEEFHSSLTPDGEVYLLRHLDGERAALITRQAEQLSG